MDRSRHRTYVVPIYGGDESFLSETKIMDLDLGVNSTTQFVSAKQTSSNELRVVALAMVKLW